MTSSAALLLGAGFALLAWRLLRSLFQQPVLRRTNYRGREVATAGGLVLVVAVVLGEVVLSAATRYSDLEVAARDARRGVLAATVGFALLGLLDDLAGDATTTGYRGHLRALARGEVTTGVLKVLGGVVVALASVAIATEGLALPEVLLDGALVALSANLVNLLDRRPGRAAKATLAVGAVVLLAGMLAPELAGVALVVGATAGLLRPDLAEEVMVGDTGANPMGAALGLGVVLIAPAAVVALCTVAVLALNLASERYSFTEVIERQGPLRWLDSLGRSP